MFPKNGLKPIEAKNTRAMAGGTPLQNTGQDPLCLHSEEGTGVELNGHLPAIPYTQYDQI